MAIGSAPGVTDGMPAGRGMMAARTGSDGEGAVKRWKMAWLAVAGLPSAWAAEPPVPRELQAQLAAFDVPGIAMVTLTDCQPGEAVVAGQATLEPPRAVTPDTVFEAASLSKPVFAWLVMQLADEKLIDLDRPLADTFDYARIPDKTAYAKLTPRLVLTHRTGLPNWAGSDADFPRRTAPIPFVQPPGTANSYSGEAFQLLQAFVEHTTGRSLQALFQARLGQVMPQSTFVQPLRPGTVASRGYASAAQASGGRDMTTLTDHALSAASLVTTAQDYARFLSLVCRREGLSRAAYDDMLRPQAPLPQGDSPGPTARGLSWTITDLGGQTRVSHNGSNGEYRAFAGFSPETRDGVVILTNGVKGRALIDALLKPPAVPTDPAGQQMR